MWVDRRNIVKSVRKIEEGDFTLATTEGVYKGTGTDNYVATSLTGEQTIVSKDEFERNFVEFDLGAMAQGYMEMGDINLEMANEGLHSENDAQETIDKLLK